MEGAEGWSRGVMSFCLPIAQSTLSSPGLTGREIVLKSFSFFPTTRRHYTRKGILNNDEQRRTTIG
jgi:hypothetical protein